MSLFPDPNYVWRETFFVCLPHQHQPTLDAIRSVLAELTYPAVELESEEDGAGKLERFAALAEAVGVGFNLVYFPPDVESDDGTIERLLADQTLFEAGTDPHRDRLLTCDARIDVYHFERATLAAADAEDEVFDPGPVLNLLSRLAKVCHGVAIDPQSNAIL